MKIVTNIVFVVLFCGFFCCFNSFGSNQPRRSAREKFPVERWGANPDDFPILNATKKKSAANKNHNNSPDNETRRFLGPNALKELISKTDTRETQ